MTLNWFLVAFCFLLLAVFMAFIMKFWRKAGPLPADDEKLGKLNEQLIAEKERAAGFAAKIEEREKRERELLETISKRDAALQELNQKLSEAVSTAKVRTEQAYAAEAHALETRKDADEERTIHEKARRELTLKCVESSGQVKALQAELEAERKRLNEAKAAQATKMAELEAKLNDTFQALASRILDEKAAKLNEESGKSVRSILEPFGVSLREFKDSVTKYNDEAVRSRGALSEQLLRLGQANARLNEEAAHLTNALKSDSQKQGRWGEVTLEMLLESSGLERGILFRTQEQLKDETGENLKTDDGTKMRPDVVVRLPDQRYVVIDAKCSLTAFMDVTNPERNPAERAKALEDHVRSVKAHIDELSVKGYDKAPGSLDCVFMFIPSEAAYAAAMQADTGLWEYANKRRIALVCPMTLLSVLKVVNFMWTQQKQIDHVKRIVERGRLLYEKAAGFVDTFQKMRNSVRSANEAADAAYGQLTDKRGNLIWQAEQLKQCDGILSQKKINAQAVADAMPTEQESASID